MITEEEIARAIRDALHLPPACDFPQCECGYECEREDLSVATYKEAAQRVLALVQPAIDAAVAAERERCAGVADEYADAYHLEDAEYRSIAAAIRKG